MRAEAAALGHEVEPETVALFEHAAGCKDCEIREHNDPQFCGIGEAIMDGDEDDWCAPKVTS